MEQRARRSHWPAAAGGLGDDSQAPSGRQHDPYQIIRCDGYRNHHERGQMIRLPAALVPLRNMMFRRLWTASVIAWLGTWLQNTGAGWLMTILAPEPLIVAMVQ